MRELTAQEIKSKLLNIMIEFKNLCDQYGLEYSLAGGTLLGAVRHQGFIPWDDDVDFLMDRPTYNKMIEIFSKKGVLPNNLKLVGYDVGNSIYPFIKIVDTNTEVEEYASIEEMGLWIDIFPVDGLPATKKEIRKTYKKAEILRNIVTLIPARKKGSSKLRSMVKPFAIFVSKNIIGYKRVNKWCAKLCASHPYETSENVGGIIWGLALEKEAMKKTDFEKKVELPFENHQFKAMSNYKEYLTNIYGDYMQLPPEEDRKLHLSKVYVKDEK